MANFVFVVPSFHGNLYFATKALVEADHKVAVITASDINFKDTGHVTPYCVGGSPDPNVLRYLFENLQPDLVFIRNSEDLSATSFTVAKALGLHMYWYDLRPMTKLYSPVTRLKLRRSGRPWLRVTPLPGLDTKAKTDWAATYLPWPTQAFHVEQGAFRDMASDPLRIICVGKLRQIRKNQHLLIEALRPLAGRVQLTLVGSDTTVASGASDAHMAFLEQAADQEDWITLKRNIPFDGMPLLYAQHHICAMPSFKEPLGIAPVEAMAYGTIPLISTQSGSAGYLTHGENGMRFDMTTPVSLTQCVETLLDDKPLRLSISKHARRYANTELSPQRFVERAEALLKR